MLMDRKTCKDISWSVILLIGGAFALSKGVLTSGVSTWISINLEFFEDIPYYLLIPVLTILLSTITEFTRSRRCAFGRISSSNSCCWSSTLLIFNNLIKINLEPSSAILLDNSAHFQLLLEIFPSEPITNTAVLYHCTSRCIAFCSQLNSGRSKFTQIVFGAFYRLDCGVLHFCPCCARVPTRGTFPVTVQWEWGCTKFFAAAGRLYGRAD
jgi:hypothetical protein